MSLLSLPYHYFKLSILKTATKIGTPIVKSSISQYCQPNRFYTTNIVKECPKPEYDTGCTFCKPKDMFLFEKDRRNPNNTVPFIEKFIIINDGHSGKQTW